MTDPTSGTRAFHGPESRSSTGPEDETLVRSVLEGSREALGHLYRRHRGAVYRLAYRLTGSTQDAEDVLQDVFVGLPRALERYQDRGRFRSWLLRVVARTALMRCRARRRFVEVELAEIPAASPAGTVERIAAGKALGRMSEALRQAFILCEIEGYSHREAAELLDISVGASRTRLHRAWAFLHDHLGREE